MRPRSRNEDALQPEAAWARCNNHAGSSPPAFPWMGVDLVHLRLRQRLQGVAVLLGQEELALADQHDITLGLSQPPTLRFLWTFRLDEGCDPSVCSRSAKHTPHTCQPHPAPQSLKPGLRIIQQGVTYGQRS